MIEITPPKRVKVKDWANSVFLAGSIEMDKAEHWQKIACELFAKYETKNTVLFNPRRPHFDVSQKQSIENPYFVGQVDWELDYIEYCKAVIIYFDPKTASPISLMELGYLAGIAPEKTYVICTDEFYRKGNVDVMCKRRGIKQFNDLESAVKAIASI